MLPVIAVYDRKTGLFDFPFAVRHNADAVRGFDQLTTDANTKFGKHPEDYVLYQIGNYDDTTGTLIPLTPHTHLANGVLHTHNTSVGQ